jgi:hypothetical protein
MAPVSTLQEGAQIGTFRVRQYVVSSGYPDSADRRVRECPKPRRQERYVIRLAAVLAELCRIVPR